MIFKLEHGLRLLTDGVKLLLDWGILPQKNEVLQLKFPGLYWPMLVGLRERWSVMLTATSSKDMARNKSSLCFSFLAFRVSHFRSSISLVVLVTWSARLILLTIRAALLWVALMELAWVYMFPSKTVLNYSISLHGWILNKRFRLINLIIGM